FPKRIFNVQCACMAYIFVGLGNPGSEYEHTRHNAGARMVDVFRSVHDFSPWKEDKKRHALVSVGETAGEKTTLVFPQTFMNKSGSAVSAFVKNKKTAEHLVVIYDDMDLPLGHIKISFGRSSGGHNGLESVIKALKTKDFIRVRVGVSPVKPGGKIRKPKGEQKVLDFLLGKIGKSEIEAYKKVEKEASAILLRILEHGWMKAASMRAA
ncbi:MAG: peptidyl-tRNA hydrolase, PTH1 family, partial [Parcubacteria group bacterium Greene0416_14]